MKIKLTNNAGITKECKLGFSWTMLFFGLLVPLFRGDGKWAGLSLLISILTCGLGWLVFPFIYNKKYIETLLEKGYKTTTPEDRNALANKYGIIAPIV